MSSLSDQTKDFNAVTSQAAQWFETHGPEDAARQIRAIGRQAKRMARSSSRPQAFAVYGASQAGKSYLMGQLAAPEKEVFQVTWPGKDPIDFLGASGINPQNQGESSGLVSRFTTTHPPASPDPAMPVAVEFLSPVDVVLIISNSFFSDFDLSENYQDLETEIMPGLASLKPETKTGLLDINDIEFLEEYLKKNFPSKAQFVPFKQPDYWEWMKKNAPYLSLPNLVQALSPLWRKTDFLTSFVRELLGTLEQIGTPDIAFFGMDALLPSSSSILNVNVLSESSGMLQVITPSGKQASIPRYAAAALVAELIIPLTHPRWDFQNNADLLDFPGARARESFRTVDAAQEKKGHLFLRGKVDYLFQRYQDNMEITSTLLCVGPSNLEAKNLALMIENWISYALGATPEERVGKDETLFLILTKFDESLADGGAFAAGDTARWDRRMEASLEKAFGTSQWVTQWTPDQTFKNTFWLRAPRFANIYEVDADGREIPEQYKKEVGPRIDDLRTSHARSEKIRKYIRNPNDAFDGVMAPNDGGITYLAKRLEYLGRSRAKDAQIQAILTKDLAQALKLTRAFYHDSSAAEEEKRAREEAKAFVIGSLQPMQDRGRYGRFLERLIPSTNDIAEEWRRFNTETDPSQAAAPKSQSQSSLLLSALFSDDAPQASDQAEAAPAANKDRYDNFAARILDYWNTHTLGSLLEDTEESKIERAHFSLSPETLNPFLQQLWRLQKENGFAAKLADRLREQCSHESLFIQRGEKAGIICSEMLGNFVTCLGFTPLPANAPDDGRPKHPQTGLPIFTIPDTPPLYPDIQNIDGGEAWLFEWCLALVERFKELGPSFDPVANATLGKIVDEYTSISGQTTAS